MRSFGFDYIVETIVASFLLHNFMILESREEVDVWLLFLML